MPDFVKAYYDPGGVLRKWVIVTNEPNYNHTVHDKLPGEEAWVGVVIDKATYDAFPAALNIGGIAVHHDMNKWVAAQTVKSNPLLSTILTANAAALDAKMVSDAQKAVTDQATALAAWNALPQATRDTAIAADLALVAQPMAVGP